MKMHFIAIGGSIMHALAIDMHKQGHEVTGSDDEIYEPSKSQLDKYGLLPTTFGWSESRIHNKLDMVVLGKHAKKDNPELEAAIKLGVPIMSFPALVAKMSKDKKRVVIAGSHGKTTTTAMIVHALRSKGIHFDYLVGARIDGFENMVQLTDAPIIIIEGDEYLSSAIDNRPKILHYQPDITVVTGIEWDHMNVFPTEENYISQFDRYMREMVPNTILFFDEADALFGKRTNIHAKHLDVRPYTNLKYRIEKNGTVITHDDKDYPVKLFGRHNMANMNAAMLICAELGVQNDFFLKCMETFEGAAKRQDYLVDEPEFKVILDFAHAPSKVRATVKAVRERYEDMKLVVCLELHTFSSLNMNYLPNYRGAFDQAESSFVYYNEHTMQIKGLPMLDQKKVHAALEYKPQIFVETELLKKAIKKEVTKNTVVLLMTSGNFSGTDLKAFSSTLL